MGIKFLQNIDVERNKFEEAGFEVVTALPTTGLFEGREVMYNGKKYVYSSGWKEEITANTMYEANLRWGGRNLTGKYSPVDGAMVSELSANLMAFPNPAGITVEYSRDAGVTWLDYGATDAQKINLFTLSTNLTCGKANTDKLAANIAYMLRITINPMVCGLYSLINKAIIEISRNNSLSCWCTISALTQTDYNLGNMSDDFYKIFANKVSINGWSGYNVLNFDAFYTSNTSSNSLRDYRLVRFTFGYDNVDSNPASGFYGLNIISIKLFGDGRYRVPSNLARNNHLYSYDYQQNALFPAKVESKEVINFDVNNIEPTQTGNVTKTSTWLWQYLVQGVNWLKANKVALSEYNAKVAELVQADSNNNAYIQSVKEELTALIDEVSGGLALLAAVARSGSYNDLTDAPTLAAVATSGDYNDLLNRPAFSGSYNDLTDTPTLAPVATSGDYNDLLNRPTFSGSYNDLTDTPTIPSTFADLNGNIDAANQIGDGEIPISKLANTSMTLNGISCELGDTKTLPCIISFDGTLYKVRIYQNWLQIYRNGIWANLYYLLSSLPTECRYITDLSDPSWYDDSVSEYELNNSATTQLLLANSSTNIANWIEAINANQITFNSSVIASKDYNKGALDNIISNLKGKGYSVFVENDIDTILSSGNDWVISIKIKRFNDTSKAIIECYVAR